MPTDPKWRTIARASKQSIPLVHSVYLQILVNASNANERGRTQNLCSEDIASALDVATEDVDAVLAAMQGRVMDGDRVTGWERRQVNREDGAAGRSKAWREAKRTQTNAPQTHANANERKRTPEEIREEEIREEETTPLASTADAVPAAGLDRGRVLGTLPCAGGKVYEVCEDDLARDGPLYPAVDVAQEYRAMKGWLMADPRRQKTTKGIRRFMASWLTRAQDSGKNANGGGNGAHRISSAQQREDESKANIDAAGDWLIEQLHGAGQVVLPEPDHHRGDVEGLASGLGSDRGSLQPESLRDGYREHMPAIGVVPASGGYRN